MTITSRIGRNGTVPLDNKVITAATTPIHGSTGLDGRLLSVTLWRLDVHNCPELHLKIIVLPAKYGNNVDTGISSTTAGVRIEVDTLPVCPSMLV